MKLALIQMSGDGIENYRLTAQRIEEQVVKACTKDVDFIILPECAYPSYLLGIHPQAMQNSIEETDGLIDRIASLAKQFRTYIAIGLAVVRDNNLYNAALVFNRSGEIINFTSKSNLWHFDEKWFTAGQASTVFDTEFGKMGVMICADGRIPEIAAMLRQKGARIIIDPVNLAASAATPDLLSNQQYEFIIQARARENGVYIAACDKCGVENNMVTFLGRSFVVDPEGNIILQCSPDNEEIAICEIDLSKSKKVMSRRPELYSEMINPTKNLAIIKKLDASYKINDLGLFTMVTRFQYDSVEEYLEHAIRYIKGGDLLSADFVVLPELRQPLLLEDKHIDIIQSHVLSRQIVAVAGSVQTNAGLLRRAVLVTAKARLGELAATHCAGMANADNISVVKLNPTCSITALFDWEVDIPEIARTAMLKGADILLCYDDGTDEWRIKMMKTRAAENKIFVVRSSSSPQPDCSLIINPDGGQVCTTFKLTEHAAAAYINTALSKFKSVVPGTNVVTGRIPNFYKELV